MWAYLNESKSESFEALYTFQQYKDTFSLLSILSPLSIIFDVIVGKRENFLVESQVFGLVFSCDDNLFTMTGDDDVDNCYSTIRDDE